MRPRLKILTDERLLQESSLKMPLVLRYGMALRSQTGGGLDGQAALSLRLG